MAKPGQHRPGRARNWHRNYNAAHAPHLKGIENGNFDSSIASMGLTPR